MTLRSLLTAAALAACSLVSQAATSSINLASYQLSASYTLDALSGAGLEASAVTYARDRGTLFFVGDEGLAVVEISLTGQVLGTMALDWTGTGSTKHDTEGLTYLGNGVLVLAEERLQDAYNISYVAGGTAALGSAASVSIGATVGNVGIEGISVDPRDGSFVAVKQDDPAQLLIGSLNFSTSGGSSGMSVVFSGSSSLFGLASLSDVQTLSPVDALAGTAAADNLLILSLDSQLLVEIDRSGTVLSQFDLSGITSQAIEGVTIDENGVIYLVAEDSGTGNSRLFVLSAVPEPQTYALMLAGLAALGWRVRRRR